MELGKKVILFTSICLTYTGINTYFVRKGYNYWPIFFIFLILIWYINAWKSSIYGMYFIISYY